MKTCSCCKVSLPVEEFGKNRREKDGLQYWCKVCYNKRGCAWARSHKRSRVVLNIAKLRKRGVLSFGVREFEALRRKQNGVCAICLKVVRLVVDHDHKNGVVRGLLCAKCNCGLGFFYENVQAIYRAAEYLTDSQRTVVGENLGIPVAMTGK